MRVVLLSWDVGAPDGGLSRQAATLAGGLRRRGTDVVVVTRQGLRPHRSLDADRIVLPDLPPAMQEDVRGRLPEALAFANRVVPRLVVGTRPADVLVVEGWQPTLAALPAAEVDTVPIVAILDGLEAIRGRLGDEPDDDGDRVRAIERDLAGTATTVLWRGLAAPDSVAAALQVPVTRVEPLALAVEVPDEPVCHRRSGPRLVAVLPLRGAAPTWIDRFAHDLRGHEVRDLRGDAWPTDRAPDVVVVHDVERGDVAVHAMAVGIPLVVGAIGGLARLVAGGEVGRVAGAGADSAAAAVTALLADPDERAVLGARGRDHVRTAHDVDRAVAVVESACARASARLHPGG